MNYIAQVEPIKQLVREHRYEEALTLLAECLETIAQEVQTPPGELPSTPPPWYAWEAAVILRKMKDYDREVRVIERFMELCAMYQERMRAEGCDRELRGVTFAKFPTRLEAAKQLRDKAQK